MNGADDPEHLHDPAHQGRGARIGLADLAARHAPMSPALICARPHSIVGINNNIHQEDPQWALIAVNS
jgi:hypothetical protein